MSGEEHCRLVVHAADRLVAVENACIAASGISTGMGVILPSGELLRHVIVRDPSANIAAAAAAGGGGAAAEAASAARKEATGTSAPMGTREEAAKVPLGTTKVWDLANSQVKETASSQEAPASSRVRWRGGWQGWQGRWQGWQGRWQGWQGGWQGWSGSGWHGGGSSSSSSSPQQWRINRGY